MTILFYFIGLIAGLFSLTNLIIAVFIFLPTARRHCLAYRRAHYINNLRNFLFGPVPYGTILMVPLIATVLFLGSWLYIRNQWFEYSLPFLAGAVTSVFFSLISLPDRSGRHKRTFNMSWGERYNSSFFGDEERATLKDEQLYIDLPGFIKDARARLLAKDGNHDSSPEVREDLSLLSERYGIEPDLFYEAWIKEQFPDLEDGGLHDLEKRHYTSKEAHIIRKALIRFFVRQRKTGEIVYSFSERFLNQDDIKYLDDQKGRLLRRFWLATFCGLFASWVWLIALFGLFAISEFWKIQRLFRIPTEEDGSRNTYEFGRSIGRALICVVWAYIPVFILGSLIKLIKDYIWSLF